MKEVFMVHIRLPEVFTFEFYALIPKQRELVNQLLEQHKVLNYSLDMQRKQIWAVFEVEDQQELLKLLRSFPIIDEVEVEIHELAFHNTAPVDLPDVILN